MKGALLLDALNPCQAIRGVYRSLSSSFRMLRLRRGALSRPRMIANFAVTYRCSSRCRTCNIWQMPDAGRDELSLEEIRTLFESSRGFLRDIESIQLTGGEPFLRSDLPEIVSTIHESLPRCNFWIPTNAMAPKIIESATREMLEALGGRGLGISVSIDGIEGKHDSMRGVEGSYSAAVESLKRLAALREGHPDLGLTVGMTLTPENYGELWDVFAMSRMHGVDFSFRSVNFSDIYYRNPRGGFEPGDDLGEMVSVIRRIGRDLVGRRGLVTAAPRLRYMQGVLDYIRDPRVRRMPCSAGSLSFFLDPYGDIYPCIIMDHKLGNVRESPLEEIWKSREAMEARRRIRSGLCPKCWVECETFRDIHRDLPGLLSTALRAFFQPSTLGIN